MCEIWEEIKNVGIQEGIEIGLQKGVINNTKAIKNIMETLNYTIIEAMQLLKIPLEEYSKYEELISK